MSKASSRNKKALKIAKSVLNRPSKGLGNTHLPAKKSGKKAVNGNIKVDNLKLEIIHPEKERIVSKLYTTAIILKTRASTPKATESGSFVLFCSGLSNRGSRLAGMLAREYLCLLNFR